jgi:hypothetical protein
MSPVPLDGWHEPRCTRVDFAPLSVALSRGTALALLGHSTAPVAFLPTDTIGFKTGSVKALHVPDVPAYVRTSIACWFRTPADSSIHGTLTGSPATPRLRRRHRLQPHPFARNENTMAP